MTPIRAGLGIVVAATLAAWGPAMADSSHRQHCPIAAAAQQMDALERQVDSLQEQLDSLDDRLDALADQRRDALDQAKDRIEAVVRDEGLSEQQRDREVARAISAAESRGQATAVQARALQRTMDDLKGRIGTLRQQMRALAMHVPKADDDAG
jgi:chromosome segregation ATPase